MHPALAADARKPNSTERRSQIAQEPAIHPGDTNIHLLRDTMATFQIAGPDRSRESILRIVRHSHGFFFRIKRRNVAHRPKNFFFYAASRLGESSIDRWLYVEAAVATVTERRNAAAGNDRRSFFAC